MSKQSIKHRKGVINQLSTWVTTPLEAHIERLVTLAQHVFQVPVVSINLNDDRRFSLSSDFGTETLSSNECLHVLDSSDEDSIVIINDTVKHLGMHGNVFLKTNPRVRFYLNAPIFEKSGRKVGQLILISYKPREFDNLDHSNLDDIIRIIESEVNNYQLSVAQRLMLEDIEKEDKKHYIDKKTHLWNYEAFKKILHHQVSESNKANEIFACAVIDIDQISEIHTQYDDAFTDVLLKNAAQQLLQSCRDNDTIAKSDLHDYICLIHTEVEEHIKTVVNRIHDKLSHMSFTDPQGNTCELKITIGVATFSPNHDTAQHLINMANAALMLGIKAGKNGIEYL